MPSQTMTITMSINKMSKNSVKLILIWKAGCSYKFFLWKYKSFSSKFTKSKNKYFIRLDWWIWLLFVMEFRQRVFLIFKGFIKVGFISWWTTCWLLVRPKMKILIITINFIAVFHLFNIYTPFNPSLLSLIVWVVLL